MDTEMIQISLKGLAKYMTSAPAAQRKVLRDFKYPDPEGHAQARYYREARDAVDAHHKAAASSDGLANEAARLEKMAEMSKGPTATRLRHNARAITQYAAHFGAKSWKSSSPPRLTLQHANLRVTIIPDLKVVDGTREKLIRLEFSANAPEKELLQIISQATFEATHNAGLSPGTADVLVLDVARGIVHKGARLGGRRSKDIEAACEAISVLWPGI